MLKIGSLTLKHPTVLAPMASLTDRAFRTLTDEIGGCGLLVSEMISAEGLRRKNRRSMEMTGDFSSNSPQFIQLFGAEAAALAEAAGIVEKETRFAGIDFNMGCPVPKVVRKGEGAALLKNLPQAAAAIRALRAATKLPLTVKIRLGFGKFNVFDTLKVVQAEGADAVILHFRLAKDSYAHPARWEWAERIRHLMRIPLIGNGDISTAEGAAARLRLVDGVAVGRGALGNPFLFAEVAGEKIELDRYAAAGARLCELIEEYTLERLWLSRLKTFLRFLNFGGRLTRSQKKEIFLADQYAVARDLFLAAVQRISNT